MHDDGDNVAKLPVRYKPPPGEEGRTLKLVDNHWSREECDHRASHVRRVTYLIRSGETELECSNCGTRLDPMFVLQVLAAEESDWLRNRQRHAEETKRLSERQRTKCEKCGHLTRISRR